MLGLATGNPKYRVTQSDALKVALRAPGCKNIQNVLERIYSNTRISHRYMAIPDFTPDQRDPDDDFFYPEDGTFSVPVQNRLEKFKEGTFDQIEVMTFFLYLQLSSSIVSVPLVTEVCKKAIAQAGVSLQDIHKLVVVSSTGFLGPSLDCELIVSLGLPRSTGNKCIIYLQVTIILFNSQIAH
jgi:alpha-pyrone synthase